MGGMCLVHRGVHLWWESCYEEEKKDRWPQIVAVTPLLEGSFSWFLRG